MLRDTLNKGATITYRGGELGFLPGHFYLFDKGDGKLYFFHQECHKID